jgi:acyl-CoA thioesterase-1
MDAIPRPSQANRFTAIILAFFVMLVVKAGAAETKTMLFFGDSLTAGYGLDPDEAFPALIQKKLDTEIGPGWKVVNAGLSGETTAGGLRRLDWILRQRVDVFVIELGANDGLRGISPATSQANLQTMIDRVRAKYPQVLIVLAGMQLPTNFGAAHTEAFAAIYPDLADKNKVALIPFLLERVGGVPSLNLPDGIHPTAEGQQVVAETVWATLKPLLN